MIPKATGIVNTIVGPIMAPKIVPAKRPACGSTAICCAKAKPPISFAKIVVANIDGSAPSILYKGTTIGLNKFAKMGAKVMIPTIDNASEPIAMIPSSNCSPNPNFPPIT